MKKKKIVYLIDQEMNDWNYERLGVSSWSEHGWVVEVWNFQELIHRGNGKTSKDLSGLNIINIKSILNMNHENFKGIYCYIDFLSASNSINVFLIKLLLNYHKSKRITLKLGSIPIPKSNKYFISKNYLDKIKRKISFYLDLLFRVSYIVVGGNFSLPKKGNYETIKAHNFDYDLFLRGNCEKPLEEKYVVFLDQNYCYHFEYEYQNVPKILNPNNYFTSIGNALIAASRYYNITPVVAMHPRASYESDIFGGIKMIKGKSLSLIKNAKFIIAHDSTSIQMAVLYKKPIIFVTTNELNQTYMDSSYKKDAIQNFAEELGCIPINLDSVNLDKINWESYLNINEKLYTRYIRNYIKTAESPNLKLWDIVASKIDVDLKRDYPNTRCDNSTGQLIK